MKFSVIIPVKDDERLFLLLAQLAESPERDAFEVVVSCNGSMQDFVARTEKSLKDMPHYQVLSRPEPGPSRAINFASRHIKSNNFLILDSDCILENQFIANFINGMADNKIVRGHIVYRGSTKFSKLTSDWRQSLNQVIEDEGRIYTPNLMIDKNLFWELGGFSETMRFSYDSNFSDGAMNKGYKAHIIRDAIIYHDCHESIKTEVKIWQSYGRGRYNRMSTHWNAMPLLERFAKAIFGDLPLSILKRDPLHFCYGTSYFLVRLSGFIKGFFMPASRMG